MPPTSTPTRAGREGVCAGALSPRVNTTTTSAAADIARRGCRSLASWHRFRPTSIAPPIAYSTLRRRPAATEGAAREHAGVPPAVDHPLAVDNHVVDADGELLRLGPGRRRLHRLRVEHDHVGLEAVAQEAAIRYAQALRRERGHLADGVGQRHE